MRHTGSGAAAGDELVREWLMYIRERCTRDVEQCRERVAERRYNATGACQRRTVGRELVPALCEQRVTWTEHCQTGLD